MDEKTRLRLELMKIRSQVQPAHAEAASQGVWNILADLPEFKKARSLGAFASVTGEINTLPILEGALHAGKTLFLPKVHPGKTYFEFHPVADLKDLTQGPYGIQEPTSSRPVVWEGLDLVLVPGLAFDVQGGRLGFGKGYYDRVLPRLKKSCLTVGLGYSFQVVERVPMTQEDVPLKALLTEMGFNPCKRSG